MGIVVALAVAAAVPFLAVRVHATIVLALGCIHLQLHGARPHGGRRASNRRRKRTEREGATGQEREERQCERRTR